MRGRGIESHARAQRAHVKGDTCHLRAGNCMRTCAVDAHASRAPTRSRRAMRRAGPRWPWAATRKELAPNKPTQRNSRMRVRAIIIAFVPEALTGAGHRRRQEGLATCTPISARREDIGIHVLCFSAFAARDLIKRRISRASTWRRCSP